MSALFTVLGRPPLAALHQAAHMIYSPRRRAQ